ncbi:DJ-1 family glyoxalase III [uncultured Muribaculum sp.]|uniref:DJ-1 family glyoxalase III n=1 Tax=uncultured Muribaculum sp. TaxID=1918613 RepID=UPI0025A989D9|nr:DJ-1 family glyoxalase III [uncultured Muribaculum sp.]
MAKSYIFLADGFEEVEAMATLDIMRRAQMEVETVSITGNPVVTGAHGVAVQADICISEISVEAADEAEWIVLPGGMPGATNLASCGRLGNMITSQFEHDRKIAAICASPAVVLGPLGVLRGQDAACYPSFKDDLEKCGAVYVPQPVVPSGNIITGSGPGATFLFGLAIVAASLGDDVAASVASGMLL